MSAILSPQRSCPKAKGATPPRLDPRERPAIRGAGFPCPTIVWVSDLPISTNPPPLSINRSAAFLLKAYLDRAATFSGCAQLALDAKVTR